MCQVNLLCLLKFSVKALLKWFETQCHFAFTLLSNSSTSTLTKTILPTHILHTAHLMLHTDFPLPLSQPRSLYIYLPCAHTHTRTHIYQPFKTAQSRSKQCREVRAAGLAADILEDDWDCEESVRDRWRAPLNQFLLNLTPGGI